MNMTDLTENDVKKALEFCGGLDGFDNLVTSYTKHLSIGVCDTTSFWDHLSDVSIKDKRFAIINKVVPTNSPTDYDYIDVCINDERHTLYLSRERVLELLTSVAKSKKAHENNSYEDILRRCTEIPCYLSVYYGFIEDFIFFDKSQLDDALLLWYLNYIEYDNGKVVINQSAVKESN